MKIQRYSLSYSPPSAVGPPPNRILDTQPQEEAEINIHAEDCGTIDIVEAAEVPVIEFVAQDCQQAA